LRAALIVLLLAVGCARGSGPGKDSEPGDSGDVATDDTGSDCAPGDADCDGYIEDDCDDDDPEVHPSGKEGTGDGDGKDNDCDGTIDEGTLDFDDDGDGWTENEGDCDDRDDTRSPGTEEVIGDSHDSNCDGTDADPAAVHSMEDDLATLIGPRSFLMTGFVVADAGDMDGDGTVDIAIGAPDDAEPAGSPEGVVFVVGGAVAGDVSLIDPTATYPWSQWNDQTGEDIAGGGDTNGDGFDDLALGSVNYDTHEKGGYWGVGRLALFLGPVAGTLEPDAADALITGSYYHNFVGGLGAVSDLDEDGYADLLVKSMTEPDAEDNQQGVAHVFRGPFEGDLSVTDADVTLIGEERSLGAAMAVAGDLDGDGLADLALGADGNAAPDDPGAVWLVGGPITVSGYVADLGRRIPGTHDGAAFGYPVAGLGDINGDGLDDIAVAAYLDWEAGNRAGAAHVFLGPVTAETSDEADLHVLAEGALDNLGFSISTAGDFNGDGFPDLAVSAPGDLYFSPDGPGLVYVFTSLTSGTVAASSADVVFTAEDWWSWAGADVTSVGDQDSDGFDDLAIGAPYDSDGGDYAGKVYVVGGFAD